jgi:hypothetical protein
VRHIEGLKRLESSPHKVVLVFADASDESVVDEEYFSRAQPKLECESSWVLEIQCERDSDRLVKVLKQKWAEKHGDEVLPCGKP